MTEPRQHIAVIGVSLEPVCGVRDHAQLLAKALEREQIECSLHWLQREGTTIGAVRREFRTWLQELALELQRTKPDVVLLHYSIFAYSYRGIPLFVLPTLSSVRRARVPLVVVLHELAYPWKHGSWRGATWAMTQRLALIAIMRDCAAGLLTADFRVQWLASRRWLARRPLAMAPVFSNLPPPSSTPRGGDFDPIGAGARSHAGHHERHVGVFGYAFEGAAIELVLDALALLHKGGADVRLRLLGKPGENSPAGQAWRVAAHTRGLTEALAFSGTLSAQELSNALVACEVLLFVDRTGPSSRKGTLAAALASGRPVVAIDGRRRWPELIHAKAAVVVAPSAVELAGSVANLLGDEHQREAQGMRGGRFAAQQMGVDRTVAELTRLIRIVVPARSTSTSSQVTVEQCSQVTLGGEAFLHQLAPRTAHPTLPLRIGQQLVEGPGEIGGIARPDAHATDAILQPIGDPAGAACDHWPAGCERLDSDEPERLRPQ